MFTGPVGPVEVFFYWPEAVFWNFYWPGAIGSPLASSPAGCPKLAVGKFLGIQIFKGDHNKLRFQPETCIYLSK